MSVFVPYLAFSHLMFHPSLLFLYIHFDITCLSIFLPPLRTYITKFGELAKSDAHTIYEPKQSDKITFCGQ